MQEGLKLTTQTFDLSENEVLIGFKSYIEQGGGPGDRQGDLKTGRGRH